MMRRVVAVAGILRDVRAADDASPLEGRLEDLGVPRHRELRERLPRNAGDRVERVRLARVIDDVVEERAELGRRQFRGGIGHRLHDSVLVQIRRDDGTDPVERFRDGGALMEQPRAFQLRLPDRGDVADDLRGADDGSRCIPDGRDRQGDIEPPAILRDANSLEMIDALAAPQLCENLVFFRLALRWNQDTHRPSHQLLGSVAEQPLRSAVAGLNDPVEVLRNDGVVRGIDDRGEIRFSRAHGPFRLAAQAREAKLRRDGGEQLARAERLHEIFVGARLQPFDPRLLACACRQQDHRAATGWLRSRGQRPAARSRRAPAS